MLPCFASMLRFFSLLSLHWLRYRFGVFSSRLSQLIPSLIFSMSLCPSDRLRMVLTVGSLFPYLFRLRLRLRLRMSLTLSFSRISYYLILYFSLGFCFVAMPYIVFFRLFAWLFDNSVWYSSRSKSETCSIAYVVQVETKWALVWNTVNALSRVRKVMGASSKRGSFTDMILR